MLSISFKVLDTCNSKVLNMLLHSHHIANTKYMSNVKLLPGITLCFPQNSIETLLRI